MQPEAARLHILQLPPAEFFAIYIHAAIFQHDFESRLFEAIPSHSNAAKRGFNWLFRSPLIRVPNNVRQGLIDGQNYGAAFCLRKSQGLRKLRQRISDDAKSFGIAAQLHLEQ